MTKAKKVLKRDKPKERDTRSIRFNEQEFASIQEKADKWAGGNFGRFVRYAALHFVPSSNDLTAPTVN